MNTKRFYNCLKVHIACALIKILQVHYMSHCDGSKVMFTLAAQIHHDVSTLILGSLDSKKQHEMWKSNPNHIWRRFEMWFNNLVSYRLVSVWMLWTPPSYFKASFVSLGDVRSWAAEQNQLAECTEISPVTNSRWIHAEINCVFRDRTARLFGKRDDRPPFFNASMWGLRINARSYLRLTLLPQQTIDLFVSLTNNSSETPSLRSDLKNKWDMPAV